MPALHPLALALAIACLARPTPPARAEPASRTYALGWSRLPGAEACIDMRALAEMIEVRLKRAVFASAARADIAVEGRVEPVPGGRGLRVTFDLRDREGALLGTREILSDEASCAALGEQAALAIAVAIDPEAALGMEPPEAPRAPQPAAPSAPESSPASAADSSPMPVPASAPAPAPAPAPPPRPQPKDSSTSVREHIHTGMALGAGMLPAPAYGVFVRGGARPLRYAGFEVHGTVWLDRELEQASGEGARVGLVQGGASVCPLWLAEESASVLACAGLSAGALRARGFGFDTESRADRLTLDAEIRASGTYRVAGPWVLTLGLGLGAPMLRDALIARGAGGVGEEVFRMAPVTGRVELGIGIELP